MKTKAFLTLELEETRSSRGGTRQLKITGVRQTQPLERLSIEIELEVPDEILMPKAKLVADHDEQVQLKFAPGEETHAATK